MNPTGANCTTDVDHAAWNTLLAAGYPRPAIEAALARYDEPHRFYHDRRHVIEMADHVVALGFSLTSAQALALLFHDAVYVPGAAHGYNETLSAQLLRLYGCGMAQADVDIAACIVLDTARHEPTLEVSRLVIDLDLLRLAAAGEQYARHSREVYLELRPLIADADEATAWRKFSLRRAEFLKRLIRRDSIFRLPFFIDHFEQRARENLRRSIESVSRPDSPETA